MKRKWATSSRFAGLDFLFSPLIKASFERFLFISIQIYR
jgi:hypothetical protein